MNTTMYTEVGTISCKWEDNIAPRGITFKVHKAREISAEELIEEVNQGGKN